MAGLRIGFLKDNAGDDEPASFGDDADYSIEYDSSSDEFHVIDTDISAPILTADSSQVITFPEGDIAVAGKINSQGAIDMKNSSAILDNGTIAINFDSLANVTIPNGDLDVADNNIDNVKNIQDGGTDAISFDGSQNVEIPNGHATLSEALELQPTSTPSAPSSGWRLFSDSGDGDKLKAIDSAGNITTIAS